MLPASCCKGSARAIRNGSIFKGLQLPIQSLHAFLRESTREQHQILDDAPLLNCLARGDVDRQSYLDCLLRYQVCYGLLEPLVVITPAPGIVSARFESRKLISMPGHSGTAQLAHPEHVKGLAPADDFLPPAYVGRLDAIETDLAHVLRHAGWQCPPQEGAALPAQGLVRSLRALDRIACSFGVRYVLDGSSMGARLIHRNLLARVSSASWFSDNFWQLQMQVALEWPQMRTLLQRPATDTVCAEQIVMAAQCAFEVFEKVFCEEKCIDQCAV